MYVDVRPADGVLRVFKCGDSYGQPYVWSCSVVVINPTTIELVGVDKPVTVEIWKAIRDYYRPRGISILVRRFRPDGRVTLVEKK